VKRVERGDELSLSLSNVLVAGRMSFELFAQVLSIFLTSAAVYVLTRPGGDKDPFLADWGLRDDEDRNRDGETGALPELTGINRYSLYHQRLHRQKSISFSAPRDADPGGGGGGLASSAVDVPCSSSSISSRASDEASARSS
jgi:hypothetical protein